MCSGGIVGSGISTGSDSDIAVILNTLNTITKDMCSVGMVGNGISTGSNSDIAIILNTLNN
jgi:hypothetical protein